MRGSKQHLVGTLGRTLVALGLVLVSAASRIGAQEDPATLRGVVFDSTEMKALPGARVAVLGTQAMTNADSTGHFLLTDIPAGSHLVSFFHPRLQLLGVSAPSRQVEFDAGETVDVTLSVPSNRTLLMGWCLAEQPGRGFAAVAGVVRDSLTGVPLPSAQVTATLTNRRAGDPGSIVTRTDDMGYYRICTVPAGREVKIQPHFGRSSGRSVLVTLREGGARVEDLLLLMSAEGTVVGQVEDYTTGQPLAGATLSVIGTHISQVTDSQRDLHPGRPPSGPAPDPDPVPGLCTAHRLGHGVQPGDRGGQGPTVPAGPGGGRAGGHGTHAVRQAHEPGREQEGRPHHPGRDRAPAVAGADHGRPPARR